MSEGKVIPLEEKYKLHKTLCEGLPDLYYTKNTDYDDSFGKSLDEDGYLAATTRIGDKLNRAKKLLKDPESQSVEGESVGDTLRDMANYTLMLLTEYMLREGYALPVEWLSLLEQSYIEQGCDDPDDSDAFADWEKG